MNYLVDWHVHISEPVYHNFVRIVACNWLRIGGQYLALAPEYVD
jgi:hypothetical protein